MEKTKIRREKKKYLVAIKSKDMKPQVFEFDTKKSRAMFVDDICRRTRDKDKIEYAFSETTEEARGKQKWKENKSK